MPKLNKDGGTQCQLNNVFECQNEDIALNAKLKKDMMTLNVELETTNGSECQTKDVALNAKLKMRL